MNFLGYIAVIAIGTAIWLLSLRGYRKYNQVPALMREWATANNLRFLRAQQGVFPPTWLPRPSGPRHSNSYVYLEALDDATRRIQRIWVLVHIPRLGDLTTDNVEVLQRDLSN